MNVFFMYSCGRNSKRRFFITPVRIGFFREKAETSPICKNSKIPYFLHWAITYLAVSDNHSSWICRYIGDILFFAGCRWDVIRDIIEESSMGVLKWSEFFEMNECPYRKSPGTVHFIELDSTTAVILCLTNRSDEISFNRNAVNMLLK